MLQYFPRITLKGFSSPLAKYHKNRNKGYETNKPTYSTKIIVGSHSFVNFLRVEQNNLSSMESPTFPSLKPCQFRIPSELKNPLTKKSRKKRARKRKKHLPHPTTPTIIPHYLSDFVEDKDFLKWCRDQLPLTQKILNAKYVEKQNLERELSPPMTCQKFKSHSILFTFQEKFAKEVLASTEYDEVFDAFEPNDDTIPRSCHSNDETELETIDFNLNKPETSSGDAI